MKTPFYRFQTSRKKQNGHSRSEYERNNLKAKDLTKTKYVKPGPAFWAGPGLWFYVLFVRRLLGFLKIRTFFAFPETEAMLFSAIILPRAIKSAQIANIRVLEVKVRAWTDGLFAHGDYYAMVTSTLRSFSFAGSAMTYSPVPNLPLTSAGVNFKRLLAIRVALPEPSMP